MSNRASLEVSLGSRAKRQRKPADEPLRVLFLGDFSGRSEMDPDLKPHRISYETLETAIAALAPTATIEVDAPLSVREELNISSLDDFHPDSLAKSISTFRTLKVLGDRGRGPDPIG